MAPQHGHIPKTIHTKLHSHQRSLVTVARASIHFCRHNPARFIIRGSSGEGVALDTCHGPKTWPMASMCCSRCSAWTPETPGSTTPWGPWLGPLGVGWSELVDVFCSYPGILHLNGNPLTRKIMTVGQSGGKQVQVTNHILEKRLYCFIGSPTEVLHFPKYGSVSWASTKSAWRCM